MTPSGPLTELLILARRALNVAGSGHLGQARVSVEARRTLCSLPLLSAETG